jgi:N-acetyltransferase
MSNWIQPSVLSGKTVSLEPLQNNHREALLAAASDGQLWKLWYTGVPGPETIGQYINTALTNQKEKGELPFVVRQNETNQIVGCTRMCNVDLTNQRLEIGYTWYAQSVQRTAVNTECKLLMLQHAFETLSAIAVEFRTHWFNQRSRNAILRLGAKQDGVLRNHQRMPDGSLRDTVVFSIINSEWPAVKNHLQFQLANQHS